MACCRKQTDECVGLVALGGTDVSLVAEALQKIHPSAMRFRADAMYLPTSNVPLSVLYPDPEERLFHIGDLAYKVAKAANSVGILEVDSDPFHNKMNGIGKVCNTKGTDRDRIIPMRAVNVYTAPHLMKSPTPMKLINFASMYKGEEAKGATSVDYITRKQIDSALDKSAELAGTDLADTKIVRNITQQFMLKHLGFRDSSVNGVYVSPRWSTDLVVNSSKPAQAAKDILTSLSSGIPSLHAQPGQHRIASVSPHQVTCPACQQWRPDVGPQHPPCGACLSLWGDALQGSNYAYGIEFGPALQWNKCKRHEKDISIKEAQVRCDADPNCKQFEYNKTLDDLFYYYNGPGTTPTQPNPTSFELVQFKKGAGPDWPSRKPTTLANTPVRAILGVNSLATVSHPLLTQNPDLRTKLANLPAYFPVNTQNGTVVCNNGTCRSWFQVTVVRRSIFDLEEEKKSLPTSIVSEHDRFWDAVEFLMKNAALSDVMVSGGFLVPTSVRTPPTNLSEWFRLACVHGGPDPTNGPMNDPNINVRSDVACHHGLETFGLWHRAYLLQLEMSLRRADLQLGGNGCICLPYWDSYTTGMPSRAIAMKSYFGADNMHVVPKVDHAAKKSNFPNRRVGIRFEAFGFGHHRFIESYNSNSNVSLESWHDMTHVLAGWPLASMARAAFDPLFWLHHCNIDRIYQMYIKKRTLAVVKKEFQNSFSSLRGVTGNWNAPFLGLIPPPGFPATVPKPSPWALTPEHCFEPEVYLTFKYANDDLGTWMKSLGIAVPRGTNFAAKETERSPFQIAFKECTLEQVGGSWTMAVVKKGSAAPTMETLDGEDCVGYTSIFRSDPKTCENCKSQVPFTCGVDCDLDKLPAKCHRYNAEKYVDVYCYCANHEEDGFVNVANTSKYSWIPPCIAAPSPQGPLFAHQNRTQKAEELHSGERAKLLELLSKYGYCKTEGEIKDGIKQFQERHGIEKTGDLCKETKRWLMMDRLEDTPDVGVTVSATLTIIPEYLNPPCES